MQHINVHISTKNTLIQAKWLCLLAFLLFSCKKEDSDPSVRDEIISPTTGTVKELTLDSIFLYARQLYIWNEALPSYTAFAPRDNYVTISPDKAAYERALYDLSQYKRRADDQPYEWSGTPGRAKYSYLENYSGTNTSARIANNATTSATTEVTYWITGDKNIAYVYLASFPDLPQIKSKLEAIAAELQQKNVTHLILDLRHNGGGYVSSVEYLANLLAPQSLEGKVMFSEQFNSRVQEGRAHILQYQAYLDDTGKPVSYKGRMANMADVDYSEKANTNYFSKKGDWNGLKQISFLVSKRTASAAELLISIFRPYLDIRLIGEQTYGKPVGFFPVKIDAYQVYLASFILRNGDGWSDYFDGMPVDIAIESTGSYLIGDSNEPLLAAALDDITKSKKFSASVNKNNTSSTSAKKQAESFVPIYKQSFHLKKDQRY